MQPRARPENRHLGVLAGLVSGLALLSVFVACASSSGLDNGSPASSDGGPVALSSLTTCKASGPVFTYNQGAILGGLVDLARGTDLRNSRRTAQRGDLSA
jgi:hypothetical protein